MTVAALAPRNAEAPVSLKALRNAEYIAKVEKAVRDLDDGRGVTVTMEELEAWEMTHKGHYEE
ncbi:MAG: hypothetical protein LBR38_05340 [Synergistaceae bacterium]|jgi:hypothetical protein|nr:hypothetical protein [Synergistaceae bacterium]